MKIFLKTFFYVIEWRDTHGSRESGLIKAESADLAFAEAERRTCDTSIGFHASPVGDVIVFNKVNEP